MRWLGYPAWGRKRTGGPSCATGPLFTPGILLAPRQNPGVRERRLPAGPLPGGKLNGKGDPDGHQRVPVLGRAEAKLGGDA